MKRLLPQSLAGRLIALLVLALVVSQVLTFVIFVGERRSAVRLINQQNMLVRIVSMVRLLQESPPELHERLTRAASTRRISYWLSPRSMVSGVVEDGPGRLLVDKLKDALGDTVGGVKADVAVKHRHKSDDDDDDEDGHEYSRHHRFSNSRGGVVGAVVSLELAPTLWLNVATKSRPFRLSRLWPWIFSLVITGLAITLVVIVAVRRITKPMARLADAAERLGRGEGVDPLPEDGAREVRRTTRAFNEMRERLSRFVDDRTRTLGAISHDLRTPITTLRLRAEFIEDEETRSKILETLDEMQSMAEATLAFVREDSKAEETRTVDLSALLASICDDLSDLGQDVNLEAPEKVLCRCRASGLKRALRNVIENAARYGVRARISLVSRDDRIEVTVDDDGPGIPVDRLEDVFQPFVRLETSRNKETGGVGLGLAIARSIVRGHGGDIVLENRATGGLRVFVTFPSGAAGNSG